MSHILRVLYFTETGTSWFCVIFVSFIFVDVYVDFVPRCAESNFNFVNGHILTKYAKLNPPQNIRHTWYTINSEA